jgi:2-methylcitrate dehydratase PrpD
MTSFQRLADEDPMDTLCRMVVETQFDDIPREVREFGKKQILDIIGVAMGGSGMDGIADVVDYVRDQGGKAESHIPFFAGEKVPAAMAAFALAPMARAMDMGDTHHEAGHGAEYTIPTLLAASGLRKTSGREFLTAFIVAQELMIRVGLGCSFKSIEQPGGSAGGHYIFGAVAAAGKLLGFDHKELMNALGIAKLMTQPHDASMYNEGASMIRFHHGFVAQDAINVVRLSRRGVTGPVQNFLAGEQRGYYALFARKGRIDLSAITQNLGTRWEMTRTSLKAHAACKCTHTGIDLVLQQMEEHGFGVSDIKNMHLAVGSLNWTVVAIPQDQKWNPETVPQCQFSLPYVISSVVHDRGIFLDAYSPQARTRADVRAFMRRISAELDENLPPLGTRVTTRLRDGRTVVGECTIEKGHPDNPLTVEDVVAKFRRCAPFAAQPLEASAVSEVIESVLGLEAVENVADQVLLPLVPRKSAQTSKARAVEAAS